MLQLVDVGEETILVPVPMTKRQIANLFYREVRSETPASSEQHLQREIDKEAIATKKAKHLLQIAYKRTLLFDRRYFDDPSWHALLDLYVQESEGKMTSVSSACTGTLAAPTTALRHIENLTNNGLLVRIPDPDDKRRVWVALARHVRKHLTELLGTQI